jgi:hypothetical protein
MQEKRNFDIKRNCETFDNCHLNQQHIVYTTNLAMALKRKQQLMDGWMTEGEGGKRGKLEKGNQNTNRMMMWENKPTKIGHQTPQRAHERIFNKRPIDRTKEREMILQK